MAFLNYFVKTLILARAKEKMVSRAMQTIKKLPKKDGLPLLQKRFPRIPPPRPLPTRFSVPKETEIPVPTLQVPKPTQAPIEQPRPLQQQPTPIPKSEFEMPKTSEGYTRIVLPPKEITEPELQAPKLVKPKTRAEKTLETKPKTKVRVRPVKTKIQLKEPAKEPAKKSAKTQKPIAGTAIKTNLKTTFGDITDFLKDPYVKAIEYSDGKLKITTTEGEKEHGTLSEEEARKIIENFAKAADVKVKPAFEAAIGNIKMSAVLSEVLGVKFVIEKL